MNVKLFNKTLLSNELELWSGSSICWISVACGQCDIRYMVMEFFLALRLDYEAVFHGVNVHDCWLVLIVRSIGIHCNV